VNFKQGDIILLNFNPTKGREQSGKRPALIISNNIYYKRTGLLIVCPISKTDNKFPLHIPIPSGLKTTGTVLTQHIRTIDPDARELTLLEELPSNKMKEILKIVNLIFK